MTRRESREARRVVALPRNAKRYWRKASRAKARATRVAAGRRGRAKASWSVRAGRLAFFGFLALLVIVRIGDFGIGHLKPTSGCKVTGVVDGDTVRLSCPGSDVDRGRLLGFDTPEIHAPKCASEYVRGVAATWQLRKEIWIAGEIETREFGNDRYGRRLVALFLDGENAASIMIGNGLARPYAGGRRQGWCE